MKKLSSFFIFLLPFITQAQVFQFSPKFKTDDQFTYRLFKNELDGNKIEGSKQNSDTILFHLYIRNANKEKVNVTFRYDFSKIKPKTAPLIDFNYILNKTLQGNVDLMMDSSGISITNREEILKRYKYIIKELMQKASTEDKMVYEDLMDELDAVEMLEYLLLEDFEVLNSFWNISLELNQKYKVEDEIESPYSVQNIAAEGTISVEKYEHDTTALDINIQLIPHSEKSKKEVDAIRSFLRERMINGDKMKPEEVFYIQMKYRYLFDIKTHNTLFASKLRILNEGYNNKIRSTVFELVD